MKNSIIYKTALAVSAALLIVMTGVGWVIYLNQTDIIEQLQSDKKETILKYINKTEKEKLTDALSKLEDLSKSLTNTLSDALYNSDSATAKNSITNLLAEENVIGIVIYDGSVDENFLAVTKDNKNIEKYKYFKFDLEADDEQIGYFKIYYDNSDIIANIQTLKSDEIKQFNTKVQETSKQIQEKLIFQIMVASFAGIIVVLVIIMLLKKFVKEPLVEFQNGLKSFFEYLENPSKKVRKIDINTSDEFGQMTRAVNKSIAVSMQIHGDMARLMRTMDKNVITSETDDQGIITLVSQAFCEISGYTKEELIGQPHNIVRHPDMPKESFENMWKTLKEKKTWEGEVKNLKKDGSFYWVYTIISPKCTKQGDNCGYNAIRYEITDKKEVEDLTANLEIKIAERTQDLEETKKEVESIHKHIRESIEYASLIQGAVVSQANDITPYFKDSFVSWIPKDTVGGDIWLFNELRHEDECLLFFIDCTGHGVPGAFVTMIVKAIEREIVSKIIKHPEFDISPAIIMNYFNKTMKHLLKQETKDSLSNAGWDGGIIYYNRRKQILKFAGAETPLFYTTKDGEFNTVKGNRYSVGYKKCDSDYQYKETIIEVEEGMKFYCTTDGYLDQNGGEKDFPFGKKRFGNIIKENYTKPMNEQQSAFIETMAEYEAIMKDDHDRNDDMTVIAFEIGAKSDKFTHTEILRYEGVITQNVVATSMDNIDSKITNMGMMGKISTLTIELLQNMMNYSKDTIVGSREIMPAGYLHILQTDESSYKAVSKNIISIEDKEKIEPKLLEIQSLDPAGIKKRYRELRKSGQNTHEKGGGIGFYEIAKLCTKMEYNFTAINEDKFYFELTCIAQGSKKKDKTTEDILL